MQAANNFLVVKKEKIEEKRSRGGIILNVSSVFDFKDEFSNRNICKAEVVGENPDVPFLKKGDRIMLNDNKGARTVIDWEDYTIITKEQFIAKIEKDGRYIVPPECVMLKVNKIDRDNLFSKWIVRHDGVKVQLFIQPEYDKNTTQRSQKFVSLAEIVQVGEVVSGINVGDIGIMDYTLDNDLDSVLYFDEEGNKFIVTIAITKLHEYDQWAYGNRISPRDTLVAQKGEIEVMSPLLGIIRGDKLIARYPYVFLNHKSAAVEKVTHFGIIYTEHQDILERTVLAASEESTKRWHIKEGKKILANELDVFDCQLKDSKIQCIQDCDILMRET